MKVECGYVKILVEIFLLLMIFKIVKIAVKFFLKIKTVISGTSTLLLVNYF